VEWLNLRSELPGGPGHSTKRIVNTSAHYKQLEANSDVKGDYRLELPLIT
jgi:hypothetical protein